MSLTVRAATRDDAAGMVAVLRPIIEAKIYSSMTGEITLASQQAYLETALPHGMFFVALDPAGNLVGVQNIDQTEDEGRGEIATFVDLDQRGTGIGHALAKMTLPDARTRGLREVTASIRSSNEGAIDFYRSVGFEDHGWRSSWAVHGRDEEIVRLTLRL